MESLDESTPILGAQIKYAGAVISAHKQPLDAGGNENGHNVRLELARQYSKVVMQIVVSLIVLVAGFSVLFVLKDESLNKAAFGAIGMVVGYWLR